MLSFSIVINTLNRATLLENTLESFKWLNYAGTFEVIVVNGPSTDHTAEVIAKYAHQIKVGRCPIANLSMSRNIGIAMADGDIVVFIDDDALAEPEWLSQLAAAYDKDEIGGAGGSVFDQTGYSFQYQYSTATRLANSNWAAGKSAEHLCFPGSFEFPYLQGTNASFRRTALLEVGGFDEEIEFYLDETELCCRLIDAGYVIRQLSNAYVHHKFAPSNIRDTQKITRYRYPVMKNKIYFALKHGRPYFSLEQIIEDNAKFIDLQKRDIQFHIDGGRLDATELERFKEETDRALNKGMQRGLESHYEYITPEKQAKYHEIFKKFTPIIGSSSKKIVLVSKDFPPHHGGGIAVLYKHLAEALAKEGHYVHLITASQDINRVDFEHGVWIHRMVSNQHPLSQAALELRVPQHIWNWSATALQETRRIATHAPIDLIETPIWDCEGVAFFCDKSWPLVTSLQTTLHFWLESHADQKNSFEWMNEFGWPMLNLEKTIMMGSDGVRSISQGIKTEIEHAYDLKFAAERIDTILLGIDTIEMIQTVPVVTQSKTLTTKDKNIKLLFVGRLEERKGIDVLLASLPDILKTHSNVSIDIVGDYGLAANNSPFSYRDIFIKEHQNEPWLTRVHFHGKVSQTDLLKHYNDCDIFVAPSRFESFGIIFLEAMRVSKPVIGCRAGGMPEIIEHDINGLLAEPGDVASLTVQLDRLIRSPSLRQKIAENGKSTFDKKFTSKKMAINSINLFNNAIKNHG